MPSSPQRRTSAARPTAANGARDHLGGGLGIADGRRAVVLDRPVDHPHQVLPIARGHDDQVGQRPQVGEVEGAMMGGAVGADQSGAVQQQRDRQVLQGDFLEDLVVGPLHEGAVDIDQGPHPGLGQPGGEGHGVRLADAHVEEAVGKLVADRLQHGALAHGRGDDGHAGIAPHLPQDRLPADQRVGGAAEFFFADDGEPSRRANGSGVWKVVGSSAAGL